MKKRILSMLLAVYVSLTAFVFSASATEDSISHILVLGDSISTGYGLASASTESFAALLKTEGGFTVNNKAVDGNTTVGLMAQFNTNAITESEIKEADIVTITCGGNDLMALLYSRIAEVWNERTPNDQIAPSDVPLEMSNSQSSKRMGLMSIALNLLNSENELYFIDDPEFTAAISRYIENLDNIVAYIHSKNSSAKIIVATQYNPYAEFENATIAGFIKLDPICNGIEAGVKGLNDAIISNSADGSYFVADVKAAFDNYSGDGDLYNASPDSASLNVDFHPTSEGHKVIAETFLAVIEEINVSNDNNTSDVQTPQTGDAGNVWKWTALLIVGASAFFCVVNKRNNIRL